MPLKIKEPGWHQRKPCNPRSLRELATWRFLTGCTREKILAVPEEFWNQLTKDIYIEKFDMTVHTAEHVDGFNWSECCGSKTILWIDQRISCKEIYRLFKERKFHRIEQLRVYTCVIIHSSLYGIRIQKRN